MHSRIYYDIDRTLVHPKWVKWVRADAKIHTTQTCWCIFELSIVYIQYGQWWICRKIVVDILSCSSLCKAQISRQWVKLDPTILSKVSSVSSPPMNQVPVWTLGYVHSIRSMTYLGVHLKKRQSVNTLHWLFQLIPAWMQRMSKIFCKLAF